MCLPKWKRVKIIYFKILFKYNGCYLDVNLQIQITKNESVLEQLWQIKHYPIITSDFQNRNVFVTWGLNAEGVIWYNIGDEIAPGYFGRANLNEDTYFKWVLDKISENKIRASLKTIPSILFDRYWHDTGKVHPLTYYYTTTYTFGGLIIWSWFDLF